MVDGIGSMSKCEFFQFVMILGHIPRAVCREPFVYVYAAVTKDEGNTADGRFPTASIAPLTLTHTFSYSFHHIGFSTFTEVDVVRHPLVQEIILAYGKGEKTRSANKTRTRKK